MRSVFITLVACALGACGSSGTPDAASVDDEQAALSALSAESGAPWIVRWHPDVHTPALLEGRTAAAVLARDGTDAAGVANVRAAQAFLTSHAALFHLRSAADELALDDADGRSGADELGMTHLRFGQRAGGVPVWGHELRMHFDRDGALVHVDGRYAPLAAPASTAPVVTKADATAAAITAATGGTLAGSAIVAGTQLVVDPVAGDELPRRLSGRLAWRVELLVEDAAQPARHEVFVDARSGEPYRRANILDTLEGTGKGVFGDARTIGIVSRGARFYLEDEAAGKPAQSVYSAAGGARLPGTIVSSDRPDRWDDTAPAGRGAAVDAQAFMAITEDYYQRVHGRRGALGKGAGMRATVHYGRGLANAFWNGRQLAFGDGDGRDVAPLAGALDVVAHEFTHAVSESAARLGHDGEGGSLNEAVSDIFGCFVEQDASKRGDWVVGGEIALTRADGTWRDAADPHRSGNPARTDEMSRSGLDNGGVHTNSTIVSHAAYLMTAGGTDRPSGVRVKGLGRATVEAIWYRALARYLGPTSGFREAAEATIAAARDLHGARSDEADEVTRAWQAVGVLPGS